MYAGQAPRHHRNVWSLHAVSADPTGAAVSDAPIRCCRHGPCPGVRPTGRLGV